MYARALPRAMFEELVVVSTNRHETTKGSKLQTHFFKITKFEQ